ncbi:MAG: GAF domain-containing protein [Myxococcota bacterium]|nr:GAF domain-containing protein [Myxococcota bacterium]
MTEQKKTAASSKKRSRKKAAADSNMTSLKRDLRNAELLLNISQQMAACESSDKSLETFLEIIVEQINAERGTLFLNDPVTGELYSRVLIGNFHREIRILNTSGVAGHVFTTGERVIISNAYKDPRFDQSIDEKTGYTTKHILCVPIETVTGEVIGVAQVINKKSGRFTKDDLELLVLMTNQATLALRSMQVVERMQKKREQEIEFLDVVADITSEIKLTNLLAKVMGEATRMLNADRGTLFLNDPKTSELYTEFGAGLEVQQIRFPHHLGIAGAVFTSGSSVNIPYAYADLRFNPAFDKQTGYFTRSILCVPVVNKQGTTIGVTQVLNKHGGSFTDEDESRLKAFTAQISIALENAKLFDDVQNMKNYNESMLESMTNGVLTIDSENTIVTCNLAGSNILRMPRIEDIIGQSAGDFFSGENAWLAERITSVCESQESDLMLDTEFDCQGEKISLNLTISPLLNAEKKSLGTMVMMEDISNEKRLKSTMSRYMDPKLAAQVLSDGEESLGGTNIRATVLFSDIRSFTSITEELGAKGTVQFLNEYFTIMDNCIQKEEGIVDKFIGDAIMAGFGIPLAHDDDEDRALRAGIAMIVEMRKWNKERLDRGQKEIDMGLGLNTDLVVSGNIGSPKRMDYTMIGDGVNLAARLESACKQYSARILISENTYKSLRGTYQIRDIDKVVVKGKTEPVGVYEVLDYHTDETFPNLMEVVNQFNNGMKHYRNQSWEKAIAAFHEALNLNPTDALSQTYIDRCNHWKSNPPSQDWDGVWVMTSK